ncbi:MAG: 3'-5' exonuclease, partial [Firmicutes bacterium]|nr:3'-5' exonuclease [Bacillota bacterium]
CEIGICIMDWNLNDVENYCKVIKPYNEKLKYDEPALKVNKLTMAEIRKGEDASVVVDEIIDLAKKYKVGRIKPVLCGHNIVNFDFLFLEAFFKFHKKDMWEYFEKCCIDTLWWAGFRHKELDNFKLGTVLGKENIYLSDAHTALGDTESTKELAKCFLRALRGEGQGISKQKKFRETFQF